MQTGVSIAMSNLTFWFRQARVFGVSVELQLISITTPALKLQSQVLCRQCTMSDS